MRDNTNQWNNHQMKLKKSKKPSAKKQAEQNAIKSEMAMIAGIIEGSPDAVGVAVIRLDCGCRKMAAVDKEGEPASKVIVYRDGAESVCDLCKEDKGAFSRVTASFIDWTDPEPDDATKRTIEHKVLGTHPTTQ
jgi:hypothetical protein